MPIRRPALVVISVVAVAIGAFVAAERGTAQQQPPADLLILNGKVYRGAGSTSFSEAVAVRGNAIAAVGSRADLSGLRGPKTVVLDAAGRAVVPGFNDVHTHLLNGGLEMENVNLQGAGTLTEVQNRIQTFAREHVDRSWIRGRGWGYGAFPGDMPTKQQLDAVVPDRPAVMRCFDGHSIWVNSKALAAAGITRNTPDPPRGVIVRDPATGEPTGLLKETPAMDLVNRVIPPPTPAEQRRAIERASEEALRFGVTSITEAAGNPADFDVYDQVRRDGALKLRVYYSMLVNPGMTDADADALDAVWKKHPDGDWLKTGLIKMFMDGVIETNTAFMLDPYVNVATTGTPNYTPQEFSRMVRMLDRRGWQIMVHGLGDGAVREVLDGFADVAKANPVPTRGRRHRVEHIETINPADISRFGALGVIASMHPGGGFTPPPAATPRPGGRSGGIGGVWAANIGPERAARGGMWKSIRDAGGHVVFGSDWPVASLDAFSRITSIANRTPRPGGTDQRLSFPQAIDGYTSEAAYASFDENRKGTLEPGKLADIVVLGSDVFAEPPTTREAAAVYATIVDGKIAYRKN
ncbi:MAG TPA: amidohydrolase [Vicinamibacterales bacterium]